MLTGRKCRAQDYGELAVSQLGPGGYNVNWEPYLKRPDRRSPSKLSTSAAATESFAGPVLLSVSDMRAASRPEEATQIPSPHQGSLVSLKQVLLIELNILWENCMEEQIEEEPTQCQRGAWRKLPLSTCC